MATVVRRVRTAAEAGNKIEAIKAIRKARPEAGLFGAKQFFDWLESASEWMTAKQAAAHWCEEHWCPQGFGEIDGHFEDHIPTRRRRQGVALPASGDKAAKTGPKDEQEKQTCSYVTTMGLCGHELVDGKCRFVNHDGSAGVNQ